MTKAVEEERFNLLQARTTKVIPKRVLHQDSGTKKETMSVNGR